MDDSVEARLARIEAALQTAPQAKADYKKIRITAASNKFVANPNLASAQQFLKEIEQASADAGDTTVAGTPTVSTVTVTTVTTV